MHRFINDVMMVLSENGLKTVRQFEFAKSEDIEFPHGNSQGKKAFIRMALKKLKEQEKKLKGQLHSDM